jgi:hypothetical protein
VNLVQFVRQLQYILRTQTWTDSPSGPVFASVHITQNPTDQAVEQFRYPLALIAVKDGASDTQEPTIKLERIEVTLAVANAGDQIGEFAMVGGQRASQGRSQGRGLLEVEEVFRSAVATLNSSRMVSVIEVDASAADAAYTDGTGYVATRSYLLEATLGTLREYPSPNFGNVLTASSSTEVHQWTIDGTGDLGGGKAGFNGLTQYTFTLTYVDPNNLLPPSPYIWSFTPFTSGGGTSFLNDTNPSVITADFATRINNHGTLRYLIAPTANGSTISFTRGNGLNGATGVVCTDITLSNTSMPNESGALSGFGRDYGHATITERDSSQTNLSWTAWPGRFDCHNTVAIPNLPVRGGLCLTRKAGASAPTSILDGTSLFTAAFTTGYSDVGVSSGTYTYGLFAQFDENGDGSTSIRYSTTPAAVTVTV